MHQSEMTSKPEKTDMEIERLSALLAVLLPVLLVVDGVLAVVLWRWNGWDGPGLLPSRWGGGRRGKLAGEARVAGTWLLLTAVVLWVIFLAAFMIVHTILFTFGTGAAFLGLVASSVLLIATPFATGMVIRRRAHRR
jgi:hypothetical protein